MKCPTCQGEARGFGKNRNGSRRYQCVTCKKTFTPKTAKPVGDMRIDAARVTLGLRPEAPGEMELDQLWQELASDDSDQAY